MPNTQYVIFIYSTTETPDANVQKNDMKKLVLTTRDLAMVKDDYYLDPTVYEKAGYTLC